MCRISLRICLQSGDLKIKNHPVDLKKVSSSNLENANEKWDKPIRSARFGQLWHQNLADVG